MRKIIFAAFLIFTALRAGAQDTTQHQTREPKLKPISAYNRDSIGLGGPNEIAVNIAPIFSTAIGGFPDSQARFSIFYKRVLHNPKTALRAGIVFKPEVRNHFNDSPDTLVFNENDSLRTINELQIQRKMPLQFNLGIERRTARGRRWSAFVGLDLLAGFYNQDFLLFDRTEKLDSSGRWTLTDLNAIEHVKGHNFYFGATPYGGFRYAFNKHWQLSLQAGIEAYQFNGERYERESLGYGLRHISMNYFEASSNALFNEFALVYRF